MSKDVRRLYRSREKRMFAGVAGGLGEYFGIDVTIVRLLFIFSVFWVFTGVVVYIIMMVVVPEEPVGGEIEPANEIEVKEK